MGKEQMVSVQLVLFKYFSLLFVHFQSPVKVANIIEKVTRDFLLEVMEESSKRSSFKWDVACISRKEGGLWSASSLKGISSLGRFFVGVHA